MNHCLIQSVIKSEPQMRYTKDNQIPIAEMVVTFKGLRNEDPLNELKVLGWGSVAQEMIDKLKEGQQIVIEGRLKMNNLTRKDGTKEKQAELTASRIHHITSNDTSSNLNKSNSIESSEKGIEGDLNGNTTNQNWNSSPLVPEVDEIPF